MTREEYERCVNVCVACALQCEFCADACVTEHRANCARTCRDCAKICWVTATFMARRSDFTGPVRDLCAQICAACARECEKHKSEHTRECAQVCHQCAAECGK